MSLKVEFKFEVVLNSYRNTQLETRVIRLPDRKKVCQEWRIKNKKTREEKEEKEKKWNGGRRPVYITGLPSAPSGSA